MCLTVRAVPRPLRPQRPQRPQHAKVLEDFGTDSRAVVRRRRPLRLQIVITRILGEELGIPTLVLHC